MKIAYVTDYEHTKRNKLNGVGYYVAQCLQNQGFQLEFINTMAAPSAVVVKILTRLQDKIAERITKKTYLHNRRQLLSRAYSHIIHQRLQHSNADLVFSPITVGTVPSAYLNCRQPIVIWNDATFAGLIDFYPGFSNLSKRTIREGLAGEKAVFERASLLLFSSDWAAQSAIRDYQVDPRKVAVVPLGPYADRLPAANTVQQKIAARSTERCQLLWIGKSWKRKGGDLAIEVAHQLHQSGVPTDLVLVGQGPDSPETLPSFVRYLGFIDKSTPTGQTQLEQLMNSSHFLILPTQADCAPAAFREASAFGLPVLSTDVGGIPTLVRDDLNGRTFPLDTPASAYATYVHEVFRDQKRYQKLAFDSLREYEQRLNWRVAGATVSKLLYELTEPQHAALPIKHQTATDS